MKHYWQHSLNMDHVSVKDRWEKLIDGKIDEEWDGTDNLFYFFPKETETPFSYSRKGCLICNILSLRLWIYVLKSGKAKWKNSPYLVSESINETK